MKTTSTMKAAQERAEIRYSAQTAAETVMNAYSAISDAGNSLLEIRKTLLNLEHSETAKTASFSIRFAAECRQYNLSKNIVLGIEQKIEKLYRWQWRELYQEMCDFYGEKIQKLEHKHELYIEIMDKHKATLEGMKKAAHSFGYIVQEHRAQDRAIPTIYSFTMESRLTGEKLTYSAL